MDDSLLTFPSSEINFPEKCLISGMISQLDCLGVEPSKNVFFCSLPLKLFVCKKICMKFHETFDVTSCKRANYFSRLNIHLRFLIDRNAIFCGPKSRA